MAKSKAKDEKNIKAVVKDSAIAVVAPINGDRYASKYATWEDFVEAMVPEDKYPKMHRGHLK